MPSVGIGLVYGLVSGLIGSIVMAIIMMSMAKKIKITPPGIIAEKFFGDEAKKPLVLMPVMTIWGLIFGGLVASGTLTGTYGSGLLFAIIPWLALNVMMMPMVGAGFFGMKRWNMIPMISLVMHAVWAIVLVAVYGFLVAIVG